VPTKDALASIFAHAVTREIAHRVIDGQHPREVATDILRREMLSALGGIEPQKPKPWTHDGMVDAKGEPIDTEYVVIDVTPGVKRRTNKL
jgi:hypothetical protein